MRSSRFRLLDSFLEQYKGKKPPFGFNGLGELVYYRTYSRIKEDGTNEEWWETVRRVVEGTYNMQRDWIEQNSLGWSDRKGQTSAQEMYDIMWHMKFLPPGRGLWAMGSSLTEDRNLFACLNNCAFISTKHLADDPSKPFCFLMDASMLGVGVGFDTLGHESLTVKGPGKSETFYQIPDSREGWVESMNKLLNSYFRGTAQVFFDYTTIRQAGLPIRGFGGVASGPEPLRDLHEQIRTLLDKNIGLPITRTIIVDIMNMIGRCVVAGNVRRTAEMALEHECYDEGYLNLKNYEINPDRAAFGWASNNSVVVPLGADYSVMAAHTIKNGEPGYQWLDNAKAYGRMGDAPDYKDKRAAGVNPCQPDFAPVLTPDGLRTFADVAQGSLIWTEDGWGTILQKQSTGVKPIFAYKTTAGMFIGTEYHQVVSNGEKVEVRDAEGIDILPGYPGGIVPMLNLQDVVDGLVIGDGSLNSPARGQKVLLNIGENDQSYFDSAIAPFIATEAYDKEERKYEVQTTIVPEELLPLPDRVISKRFYESPNKVRGILRGLFSANGSVVRTRVTLKTTSWRLRDQVQLLLSSLGIRSYYTTNKETDVTFGNGRYTCKESYDINIMTDRTKFAALVGFIQPYKQQKLDELVNKPASKYANGVTKKTYEITEVVALGEAEVFNITVNTPKHTYWTGGLNVANCGEQTLESGELCCLVETFPARHDSLEDYKRTLKFAYLYAKTVTLGKTHWPETNRIMLRNRRIGCSMSGIVQFLAKHGIENFRQWCDEGYKTVRYYDDVYSEWMAIPKSIKVTSVKPSGTVSLLAGATPGMHYPESLFYIRRMRIDNKSDLIPPLIEAGYTVEPCVGQEESTVVVEIPVAINDDVWPLSKVSMWEQLSLAAFLQRYWADNQVSCTITFNPEEADQLIPALNYFQYHLKGVSFLPRMEKGAFPQMPYESITEEQYNERAALLKPLHLNGIREEEAEAERFCDGDKCTLGGK